MSTELNLNVIVSKKVAVLKGAGNFERKHNSKTMFH